VRARYYGPSTGRWLSQDPVALVSTGGRLHDISMAGNRSDGQQRHANAYMYSFNCPTLFLDPSGTTACTDFVDELMGFTTRALGRPTSNRIRPNVVGLAELIVCRWVPSPHRAALVRFGTCDRLKVDYVRQKKFDGFCPQLTMGGQNADVYRHIAFNSGAYLIFILRWLSDAAEAQDCRELRESCDCANIKVPVSCLENPPRRCLENQAEVIGDIIGRRVGTVLHDYAKGNVSFDEARDSIKKSLCDLKRCDADADHCCS
jgi:RHS repeat-associated protein